MPDVPEPEQEDAIDVYRGEPRRPVSSAPIDRRLKVLIIVACFAIAGGVYALARHWHRDDLTDGPRPLVFVLAAIVAIAVGALVCLLALAVDLWRDRR